MPVVDGNFCPAACHASCQAAAAYRGADGTWTTTLVIIVFCVLAVDALLAGIAIYIAGTAPAAPQQVGGAKEAQARCLGSA